MRKQATLIALAIGCGLGLAGLAREAAAAGEGTGPVPAPPGPYQSSRPYLGGGDRELPYYGAMRYPLGDRERPYFGPGRYWGPAAKEERDERERFATQPVAPWGSPRTEAGPADGAERKPAPSASAGYAGGWYGQAPLGYAPMPPWWQPPRER